MEWMSMREERGKEVIGWGEWEGGKNGPRLWPWRTYFDKNVSAIMQFAVRRTRLLTWFIHFRDLLDLLIRD